MIGLNNDTSLEIMHNNLIVIAVMLIERIHDCNDTATLGAQYELDVFQGGFKGFKAWLMKQTTFNTSCLYG